MGVIHENAEKFSISHEYVQVQYKNQVPQRCPGNSFFLSKQKNAKNTTENRTIVCITKEDLMCLFYAPINNTIPDLALDCEASAETNIFVKMKSFQDKGKDIAKKRPHWAPSQQCWRAEVFAAVQ